MHLCWWTPEERLLHLPADEVKAPVGKGIDAAPIRDIFVDVGSLPCLSGVTKGRRTSKGRPVHRAQLGSVAGCLVRVSAARCEVGI